ncbi:hypothetical protein M2283_005801 [Streptomyces pseudovenezuelae]|uniref:Uncharacterized protein n=1 Tax=Streptomyces pseudovenezuelae TaxID=67350 RepID=A0ABT6LQ72_9ACTN|nr:hypothetical protein [Streptomyces pseudovenezuelae]
MADESTAASTRRRSPRKQQSQGQEAKTAPKVLLKPANRLRARPRGRAGFRKRLRTRLADEWRLLIDSLIEAAIGASAIPSPPPSHQPVSPREPGIQETVRQLLALEPEAFEDAILHLVRTDEKLKRTYDRAPIDIPDIAHYANNAYLRELQREAANSTAVPGNAPHPTASPGSVYPEPASPGQSLISPEGLSAIHNSQALQQDRGASPSPRPAPPLASNNPYRNMPNSAPPTPRGR